MLAPLWLGDEARFILEFVLELVMFGANGGSRPPMDGLTSTDGPPAIPRHPRMARLPFLDIRGWPDDRGPSMDPAIPCLHKCHILDSIKLVTVLPFIKATP